MSSEGDYECTHQRKHISIPISIELSPAEPAAAAEAAVVEFSSAETEADTLPVESRAAYLIATTAAFIALQSS